MTDGWGLWGAQDEIGALNRIGPDEVRGAAGLVRQGKVLGLAQPLSSETLVPRHRPGIMHVMNRDGGDYAAGARRPGGFQVAEDTLIMPLHSGTHMDALCHCWYEDRLYNGFSGNEVRSRGSARLGIDKAPPTVTRGVLLDLAALADGGMADGRAAGRDMLEAALDRAGLTLRPGDAVLIRTGWLERQGKEADFNTEPGINADAARFLADAGVALVGADNFAVEVIPFPQGAVFPVHRLLIRDHGIPLLEGLVLAPLAAAGAAEFMFVAAPLPIRGGTGSPLNPLAVL